MPPPSSSSISLSPAELSFLHTSLSLSLPLRPDGRSPTQFRPLVAETGILPLANGSARVCFADGSEAVVGVRAEVETRGVAGGGGGGMGSVGVGTGYREEWLRVGLDVPGWREEDGLVGFLGEMVREGVVGGLKGEEEEEEGVRKTVRIGERFGWGVYVDILLLSQPLSYPLPLLSLATSLALLNTRLPALISQGDEDPLFNDDWAAATPLYPDSSPPPITLLVMAVRDSILFDPSTDELTVADAVVAISVVEDSSNSGEDSSDDGNAPSSASPSSPSLRVVAIRTIDPPSRVTAAGVGGGVSVGAAKAEGNAQLEDVAGSAEVWSPPRGGVSRTILARMVEGVVGEGGVGGEVLAALRRVEGVRD